MTKICKTCKKEKSTEDFHNHYCTTDGFHPECKICRNHREHLRFINNKDKILKRQKTHRDKTKASQRYKFKLTLEEINNLFDKFNNKCAICGSKEKLCIDHCHKTNTIRGILCDSCNVGLGFFKDNQENLINAADYLEMVAHLDNASSES